VKKIRWIKTQQQQRLQLSRPHVGKIEYEGHAQKKTGYRSSGGFFSPNISSIHRRRERRRAKTGTGGKKCKYCMREGRKENE
jgi:hypothetical protein